MGANPTMSPTNEPTENPTLFPTLSPTLAPTLHPTMEPTFSPSAEPSEKPTEEPTAEPSTEPVANPTAEPTLKPSGEPSHEPTKRPSPSPSLEPTLQPSLGEAPEKPDDMPQEEYEEILQHQRSKELNPIDAAPEPAKPLIGGDEAPPSPVEKIVNDEVKQKQREESEEDGNENNKRADSPNKILEPPRDTVFYCAYTHTKVEGPTRVAKGCVLIADENIDALQNGHVANAGLICGMSGEEVMHITYKKLQQFEVLARGGVSYIKPGSLTGVTFFVDDGFKGANYTFTSGYHPPITNGELAGTGTNFNDNIKSMKITSTAVPKDFENPDFPEVCKA